jgi:hypothetical protein
MCSLIRCVIVDSINSTFYMHTGVVDLKVPRIILRHAHDGDRRGLVGSFASRIPITSSADEQNICRPAEYKFEYPTNTGMSYSL